MTTIMATPTAIITTITTRTMITTTTTIIRPIPMPAIAMGRASATPTIWTEARRCSPT